MRYLLFITSISVGLLLSECDNIQTNESNTIRLAKVENKELTLNEARGSIPSFVLEKDSIKALQNYRKKWIREQLLLREAHRLQLDQQETVQKRLQQTRDEILINALRQTIISQFEEQKAISGREVQNYYQKYKDQLVLPERYVQFRHIETPSLGSARNAQQELQNGVSWPDVAHKFSQKPETKIRDAEKFWPVSTIFNDIPIMKRYVTTLDSGAISPIQRANRSYHFVQLTNVWEKGDFSDPAWINEELKEWLLIENRRKHYNSYVKNLYLNAQEDNEIEVSNVLPSDTVNSDKIETNQPNE